jgi:putative selenate reductase
MAKYLKELEERMTALGVRDVATFTLAVGGSASANLAAYAGKVVTDPRYAAPKNRKIPRRIGTHLALFDCIACDKCVAVCPNDANFAVEIAEGAYESPELVVRGGHVAVEPAPALTVKRKRQFANYADFCNDCGNCDVFCPEEGGPYKIKPRFFGARATFDADANDGFFIEKDARGRFAMTARMGGVRSKLVVDRAAGRATFSDDAIFSEIDLATHAIVHAGCATQAIHSNEGHTLAVWRYHAMRVLLDGVLAGVNPVSARWLETGAASPST